MKKLKELSLALLFMGLVALLTIGCPTKNAFAAHSDSYIALVIGNGNYRNISPLSTPVKNAADMANVLKKLGFEVTLAQNVNRRAMREAIDEFETRLHHKGGTGLFYFSGYGLQNKGHNFLVPVDANIQHEADIQFESLEVERVLHRLKQANDKIVILDCQDIPFYYMSSKFFYTKRGLAQINSHTSNTTIAIAAAPGQTTLTLTYHRNSVYTKQLVDVLSQKGTSMRTEDVLK
ncbi:MAG: hypothetical protein DRR19_00880 [Candidatus Parabeggiatoa sp. nov. 1]|nr:MAG: hypothetical protein DRR19_00880 [Gammaproteobacteria bacterium]